MTHKPRITRKRKTIIASSAAIFAAGLIGFGAIQTSGGDYKTHPTPQRPAVSAPAAPSTASPTPSTPPPSPEASDVPQVASGVPEDLLNPDVTQATIDSTICVPGWTDTVRPPVSYTEPIKKRQIAESSYADKRLSSYEEDHFIALEIGGAPRDEANLWPEPRAGAGGAGDKDSEENSLHRQVCSGQITLVEAQAQMYADWRDVDPLLP